MKGMSIYWCGYLLEKVLGSGFFSNTLGNETETFKSFEVEGLEDIRNIPKEDRVSNKCVTRWIDSQTFDYVRSIYAANRVYKVEKDGTKTPVSIKAGAVRRRNQVKGFEISLTFMFKEENILNV